MLINARFIIVNSKESSSTANASANNNKRKLSAIEPIERQKMGRRMDTVYAGKRQVEVGCMEIGKSINQTKEWQDGRLKMPIVMRDMLMSMVEETPALLHTLHTMGYSINGMLRWHFLQGTNYTCLPN